MFFKREDAEWQESKRAREQESKRAREQPVPSDHSTNPFAGGKRGFTLIEMLVVIAIIAILGAMLAPNLRLALRMATGTSCINNFRQLNLMVQNYLGDFNDKMVITATPTGWPEWGTNWGKRLVAIGELNAGNIEIIRCPGARPPANKLNLASYSSEAKYLSELTTYYCYAVNYVGYYQSQSCMPHWTVAGDGESYDNKWYSPNKIASEIRRRLPNKAGGLSTFALFVDNKCKDGPWGSPKIYKSVVQKGVGNWAGTPWAIHNPHAVTTLFGDGHVGYMSEPDIVTYIAPEIDIVYDETTTW